MDRSWHPISRQQSSASSRCSQPVLLLLFVAAVLTNVCLLLTSHSHWDHHDSEPQVWLGPSPPDSKLRALRTLQECVQSKMASVSSNDADLLPGLVPSSYSHVQVPPIVDEDVLRSFNWTVQRESRRVKSVFRFLSRPVINRHDFQYIHNPHDACTKRKIDLVIAVPSAPHHVESRHRTRQGLKGSYSFVKSNNSTLIFFLGKSSHPNKSSHFQVDINMEMRMFGDIVQETFTDVYRNLTLKSVSILKWIDRFCPSAQFVIKVDDDSGIKPAVALSALRRYRDRYGNFILGRWNPMNKVVRNVSAKIYVPPEEYPDSTFPPHVLGGGMGFPVTTARLLYQAALRVTKVWLDDVFLSGICAPRVRVPVFSDADFDFIHKQW